MDKLIGRCAMYIDVVEEVGHEVESRRQDATVESWGQATIEKSRWSTIAATIKSCWRLVMVVGYYYGEDDPNIASLLRVVDSIFYYTTSIIVAMSSIEALANLIELIN